MLDRPLSSRSPTPWIPWGRSLKKPKLALLKSRVTVLLILLLPPFRILISTISWSLQSRLPPDFTSPISPSLFVSTRSSSTLLLIGSLTTCVKKLPSMHCKNLLDCLWPSVLSFLQTSGWLNSYMSTRSCNWKATCSCRRLPFPGQVAYSKHPPVP